MIKPVICTAVYMDNLKDNKYKSIVYLCNFYM